MTISKIARRAAAVRTETRALQLRATGLLRLRILTMLVIVLWGGSAALGQRITGSITGTVTDPQGAVVPSATIKATNAETGFSRTTNSARMAHSLCNTCPWAVTPWRSRPPDSRNTSQRTSWSLSIKPVPFRYANPRRTSRNSGSHRGASARGHHDSRVGQHHFAGRGCFAAARQPQRLCRDLSHSGRNGQQFQRAEQRERHSELPDRRSIHPGQINGGIDAGVPTVSYYLDGGINMTGLRNYGNPLPNPDALQEFRVEANNFGAEYGRMSGAVVTAVTKSGTNEFHGSLFEFNRNTALNAIPWNADHARALSPQPVRRHCWRTRQARQGFLLLQLRRTAPDCRHQFDRRHPSRPRHD